MLIKIETDTRRNNQMNNIRPDVLVTMPARSRAYGVFKRHFDGDSAVIFRYSLRESRNWFVKARARVLRPTVDDGTYTTLHTSHTTAF